MSYLVLKALHIIFVVAWFCGLFYIVRLFVYMAETHDRPAEERAILLPQLQLMARRLWVGITWPAAVATSALGLGLLHTFWPPASWLWIKLGLVALLWAYHGWCHALHTRFQAGECPMDSSRLRVFNEVATLLLVSIVFVVVMKSALDPSWAVGGIVVLAAALGAAIYAYGRVRS
jgi:putative membrane protein